MACPPKKQWRIEASPRRGRNVFLRTRGSEGHRRVRPSEVDGLCLLGAGFARAREYRPPLLTRSSQGEPGARREDRIDRRVQAGDLGSDRASVAVGAEAMDRADPGHHQGASPQRRVWEPPHSSLPQTICAASKTRSLTSRCKGNGTLRTWQPARATDPVETARRVATMAINEAAKRNHDMLFPEHESTLKVTDPVHRLSSHPQCARGRQRGLVSMTHP